MTTKEREARECAVVGDAFARPFLAREKKTTWTERVWQINFALEVEWLRRGGAA